MSRLTTPWGAAFVRTDADAAGVIARPIAITAAKVVARRLE
jgi:hypothetical protein